MTSPEIPTGGGLEHRTSADHLGTDNDSLRNLITDHPDTEHETGLVTVEEAPLVAVGRTETLPPHRHPALVYLASLSPRSRTTMRCALNRVAGELTGWIGEGRARRPRVPFDVLPWHELRFQHTAALRARLADTCSPSTANQTLSALRETLKNCWRLGLVEADDYHRAVDLKPIKGERLPKGRRLTQGEFIALVAACQRDPSPIGARDAALLALGYVAGLRRAEAVALDLADWTADSGELRVRVGKGGKGRIVFLRNGGAEAVNDWIAARGAEPGPLLVPIDKWGNAQLRRLSAQAVFAACRRRAKEAGVEEFGPHDLRRSCASDMLDAGEDVVVVQRHLGHSNIATTSRYDRRGDEALKRASARLHFPYSRPKR